MAIVGSKPEKGLYKCIICDHEVAVDHLRPTLNFCPKCDGVTFISAPAKVD